jgi:hypothetical protein
MSEEELPKSGCGCFSWALWSIAVFIVAFLVLAFASRYSWLIEMPFHLIAGCLLHAIRALDHFARNLPGLMKAAIFPFLATAIALWGVHRLILWWRLANGNDKGWYFKHTALAGSLVLLGSAAAIALSGIVHEAVWLPQGKIIQSNHKSTLTMAINNARQLGMALIEHEDEHDANPASLLDLDKLVMHPVSLRRMMFVDLDNPGPPEPFVLLKPGEKMSGNPSEILMIGPQMPERGDFVILRADNSVARLDAAKFIEVVKSGTIAKPDKK